MKTGLNNAVTRLIIIEFNDFIYICLDTISLQIVRSEETAVFTGETVMRDTRHRSARLQS